VSQKLLIVGGETPAFERVMPILRRASLEVSRAARIEEAMELVSAARYDLIVVRYPVVGAALQELVSTVRAPTSPCLNSGILLLAEPSFEAEVGGLLGRGVNRIIGLDAPSERLLLAVADLLAVPPRRAVRTMVQLEFRLRQGALRALTMTHNLSAAGILVQGGQEFPVGSRVWFELILPGHPAPVCGEAEVIRHVEGADASAESIGVKVLSFADDGHKRLAAFLDHHDA